MVLSPWVPAHGQLWDGGGSNNNWSTGNNWNPNGVPVNTGAANITFGGTTRLTPNLDTDWSINSLTFNATAGAFTLGGSKRLTIGIGGITNNDADLQTIQNNIRLASAQLWTAASGALLFNGDVDNNGRLLSIAGNFNTTINGQISGSGGLLKTGLGNLYLTDRNNDFSGGTALLAGSIIVAPNSSFGIGPTGSNSYIGTGGFTAFGGVMEFAPTGAGRDFQGIERNMTLNGGTIRLRPDGEITDLMTGGSTLTFSAKGGLLDIAQQLTAEIPLGNVQVNASTGSPATIRYSSIADTTGNFGWAASGRDLNVGNLSGNGALRFDLENGASIELQQSSFSGTLLFDGVAGGSAASGSAGTAVGRLALNNATTFSIGGGMQFDNAMQVTPYGAARTLDSSITINSGETAFQGRGTASVANDDLGVGSSSAQTLQIKSGATGTMDLRFRDDVSNIGGIQLNASTQIDAGGTLKFTQSYTSGGENIDDIDVNAPITGLGSTTSDSLVRLNIGSGAGATDGVNFNAGANLVVNGTGFGGLRVEGAKANVDNLLTPSRLQNLSGTGGTLTIAYADNGTGTFSSSPSAPSNVKLGFDRADGSSPSYTIGSTANDLASFNGLVVKGGTVEAGANNAFTGAGTTALDVLGGTLGIGAGGTARTLSFEGDATLSGGVIDGGVGASPKGTIAVGGNIRSDGTSLTDNPNFTMDPGAGTTRVTGSTALTGIGTLTKNGAGTVQLDQQVAGNSIVVNSGTLLLGGDNRIGDSTSLVLNGGTLSTAGFDDSIGILSLTSNSAMDFGSGSSVLNFSATTFFWTPGTTLSIQNWSGDMVNGGGADQLKFGAISSDEVNKIRFVNPAGLPAGIYAARLVGLEVVPVPEPGTYAALAFLAGGIGWRERRRLQAWLTHWRNQAKSKA